VNTQANVASRFAARTVADAASSRRRARGGFHAASRDTASRPDRARPGFTLIELLVIIGVMGILGVAVFPQLERTRLDESLNDASANNRILSAAFLVHYNDTGSWATDLDQLPYQRNVPPEVWQSLITQQPVSGSVFGFNNTRKGVHVYSVPDNPMRVIHSTSSMLTASDARKFQRTGELPDVVTRIDEAAADENAERMQSVLDKAVYTVQSLLICGGEQDATEDDAWESIRRAYRSPEDRTMSLRLIDGDGDGKTSWSEIYQAPWGGVEGGDIVSG